MKVNNKKGITIIELIVTIALISIIMLFLYALLSNITFESDNEYIDIVDRTVREDMIRTINDTINDYNRGKESDDDKLQNYELVSGNKKVYIKDKNNVVVYSISVDSEKKATLRKGMSGDVIQTWILDTGKFDTIDCRKDGESGENKLLLITCDIKVYTANINNKVITKGSQKINNNNILDDITFTYGVYQDGSVEISSFKLTFNNNGGQGETSQIVPRNTAPSAVTKPTKNGATFDGYFTNLTPTTLTGSVTRPDGSTIRVETINNKQLGQWKGNKSDAGRFFQASLILTDNSLASAPNNVQFNDHVLNDNQYKITKLENHKWQYDIAFNITEDMVTTGTYPYETNYRFIDIEGTTSNDLSVNYIYLDEGMIFDSEGQPLVQAITKDMTVIAKWITEYQELDSITTIKGKHTYIDTKFSDKYGFRAEYVAQWLDNTGGYIVGSHSKYSPYVRAGGHWTKDRGFEFGYGDTAYKTDTPKGLDVLHTKFKVEFKTTYNDAYFRVKKADSSTWDVVNKTYSGKNISSATVYLYYSDWNIATGTANTYAKVDYVKIWDSTDKLVRDYVPVKNTSSNEIGFYDKVEGKFYKAEGTGGFTAGNPTGNMIG